MTGSKAPPAFPAPYACIPSMVLLLSAQPPLWSSPPPRCWFKGTGCAEHRETDTENPRICSCFCTNTTTAPPAAPAARMGAGFSSAPWRTASLVSRVVVFNLTSKFPVVLLRYPARGSCGLCQCCDDALSHSAGAGGGHVNAPPLSRLSHPQHPS